MVPPKQTDLVKKLDQLRKEGEERSAERLANDLGLSRVDFSKTPVSIEALKLIDEDEAKHANVAAVEMTDRKVAVAAMDPRTDAAKSAIKKLEEKKYEVKVFITSRSALEGVWGQYRLIKKPAVEITGTVGITEKRIEELKGRIANFAAAKKELEDIDIAKTTPTNLMEVVLASAFALGASDVHFEVEEKKVKIRLRVDGLLHDIFEKLPLKNYGAIVSRVKLLAGMKINVRSEAQDGRFTISFGKKEIEIRVSAIPSEFGENIVMRILNPDTAAVGIAALGIRVDDMAIVERSLAKPNGLILNTGPTGSGKTTTLYAFLKELNDSETKIITLEDPIEYRVEGIEQTQVNPESDYTFAKGLRAIVRQDPDIIFVGEVRDLDTADIAIQAALTGHLVLSTLHTNDAVGAVPRLINLGVKAVSVGPALALVIAQRLVRKLCPKCRKKAAPSAELKTNIKKFFDRLPARVKKAEYTDYALYEPAGCDACNGFGYKGRIGIFEFLEGGTGLESVILKEPSESALKKFAAGQGMVTMQEDGVLKALQGATSLKEVETITGEISW